MWRVIHKDVWNFDSEVRDGLRIQEYIMAYTSFLNLVEFLKPYVKHETTNYRVAIEVDRAIAMVLNVLALDFSIDMLPIIIVLDKVQFGNIILLLQRLWLIPKNYIIISLAFLKVKD
jgi:hypothetical protein